MALSRHLIETVVPTVNVVFDANPGRGWTYSVGNSQVFDNTYMVVIWGYATQSVGIRCQVKYPYLSASVATAFSFDFPNYTPFTFKIPDQEEYKINEPPIFSFTPTAPYVALKPTVIFAISTFNNAGDQIGISSSNI